MNNLDLAAAQVHFRSTRLVVPEQLLRIAALALRSVAPRRDGLTTKR
jgi:hypothetical protein